ncbi:hypothetical protein KAR91_12600 [Candidatus Pacearchaeota archaeon]|nr:hypothetical protein [Candidatus Pacearchaeota archaeon]
MSGEMVSVNLNEDAVKGVLKQQVAAAIVKNLGNTEELISKVIEMALSQKVDAQGKVDNYTSYNKYTFIEVVAKKAVREATDEAIKEWVQGQKESIKLGVIAELSKKANSSKIIEAFITGAIRTISSWNFECSVNFSEGEE